MKITVIKPRGSRPRPACGFVRRTWRVGRYTVTWTADIDSFCPGAVSQSRVEWEPEFPPKGAMTKALFRQYRTRRNALYQEIADIIGGAVGIADV